MAAHISDMHLPNSDGELGFATLLSIAMIERFEIQWREEKWNSEGLNEGNRVGEYSNASSTSHVYYGIVV